MLKSQPGQHFSEEAMRFCAAALGCRAAPLNPSTLNPRR